jgi:hypothetical protein
MAGNPQPTSTSRPCRPHQTHVTPASQPTMNRRGENGSPPMTSSVSPQPPLDEQRDQPSLYERIGRFIGGPMFTVWRRLVAPGLVCRPRGVLVADWLGWALIGWGVLC